MKRSPKITRIAKQPRRKRQALKDRMQLLADAVAHALHDATPAELVTIGEELTAVGGSLLATARRLPEHAEPVLMFSTEPECHLVSVLKQYAGATKIPMERLIDQMILCIGPHFENEHRWN